MTNMESARRVIALARELGTEDFCVCGGSRNAPLIVALDGADPFTFVDERSAAFFALGRAKLTARPVAVVTTSGTAVAELLPAAIEAHYSGIPLILITADRPARYRGTGAPQAIEQEGIFGHYASSEANTWRGDGPLHINVEFEEPLIDDAVSESRGLEVSGPATRRSPARPRDRETPRPPSFNRPLIILGGLTARDHARVRDFVLARNAPVYAEPLSGLREDPATAALSITAGERMIARGDFDGVIRIGNVPALRFWRDLDESRRDLPVVSFSRLPFKGLTRGELFPIESLECGGLAPPPSYQSFFAEDRNKAKQIQTILDQEPNSELSMIRDLSRTLPPGTRVYLGNSLPIREWDLVASREPRGFSVEANRGANGIDGQLSTFFGLCERGRENAGIVGDLTAIYDANAPWIVPQLDATFRLVIINNGGGRIFERVGSLARIDSNVRERLIENVHTMTFDHWSAMWGISERVSELRPDAGATRRVWERYDALWQ